jgi:hypothetical protein
VKTRLKEISQSTAVKNPKLLIGELCSVVQMLVAEVEKIQQPKKIVLTKSDEEEEIGPTEKPGPGQYSRKQFKTLPFVRPEIDKKTGPLNAGDAE